MDARLALAAELEQQDRAVAQRLEALAELAGAVAELRAGAEAVRAFHEALPGERAHLDEAEAEAIRGLEQARAAVAAAQDAVARARGEDARETARRDEARAASALRAAEERLERLRGRRSVLERQAEQREVEAVGLERRAGELAAGLAASPRVSATAPPEPGLEGVLDWASRAHAALLVARGGLETERERIVREANELASSVLGEPLHSTSVALVRTRLEAALR